MDRAPDSNGAEAATPAPSQPQPQRRTYIVGICLLGIVVLLWTSSNFIIKHLIEAGYDKPFMLTYLSTCSFSLYLVPYIITEHRQVIQWLTSFRTLRAVNRQAYQPLPTDGPAAELSPLRTTPTPSPPAPEVLPLTTRQTAQLAVIFSSLWLLANWAVNASLGYTSVASTTILTSTSGFFTLGVGALARVEKFTLLKVGAVTVTFAGVALVSLSDSQPTSDTTAQARPAALWGDTLALGSAVLYALYVVLLKIGIRSESRIDMRLFFGFLGTATLLLYWPLALLLHFAGVETLAWPATRAEWTAVGVNSLITFISDFLYLIAMLKTTPLVVTIGLSMTIPAALVGDFLLGRPSAVQALLGALLVLGGFIVIGVEDGKEEREIEHAPPE